MINISLIFALTFVWSLQVQSAEIGLKSYSGYKVIRAFAADSDQFDALVRLHDDSKLTLDFWSDPSLKRSTDIMVAPNEVPILLEYLNANHIKYEEFIEDLEKKIQEERIANLKGFTGRMDWESYQRMDTIYNWMMTWVVQYPELVTVYSIGKSYEGRDLRVMRISKSSGLEKQGFWIDGTIHAREWISPAVVTYMINELLSNQTEFSDLLDRIDFYFMPMVNPDGYEYSHVTNRMWRRTRQPHDPSGTCVGVDANRNFGYQFGGPGSSPDYCSETYRGPHAYSEPETNAVRNFIEVFADQGVQWTAFVTTHSYSQLWMTPYGWTFDLPEDYEELEEVGLRSAAAVASLYGTEYEVGSASNILYRSSGSSRDWAYGEGGFKYVYTIELRDKGSYGFILPPEQIIPSGEETWEGILVLARHLLTNK